jgi:hypothetical protein
MIEMVTRSLLNELLVLSICADYCVKTIVFKNYWKDPHSEINLSMLRFALFSRICGN